MRALGEVAVIVSTVAGLFKFVVYNLWLRPAFRERLHRKSVRELEQENQQLDALLERIKEERRRKV